MATLVTDPAPVEGAVRAVVRLDGRRLEAWYRGAAAGAVRARLAGERVALSGRRAPVPARRRRSLNHRHVASVLVVDRVGGWSPGGPAVRTLNGVRRLLVRGASSMPDQQRVLFTGMVLGDDREQDPGTVDDFRAAGLSHLLAVSGQNVAFALALAGPALRRLGLRGRFVVALVVLAGFGGLTRWEPSVLRAEGMAALSLLAATMGRPVSTVRLLALAVSGLLLVDPLLVGSLGFLLSCGASAGIAVLARPLGRHLPLPLAVTVAAQVGVAPILVSAFGGVPLASLPANLLAAPASGPVMVWGVAAGLPAGMVGGPMAAAVHLPTRLLLGWVAWVAGWAAALPLGQLGAVRLAVLAGLVVLAALARRLRLPALALGMAACLWPAAPPPAWGGQVADGARLWRDGSATVLVVDRARTGPLLAGLRRAGVRGIDVVAVRSSSATAAASLAPVLERHSPRVVLTPGTVAPGTSLAVGRLRVDVAAARPRLEVEVGLRPGPEAAPPANR